MTITNTELEQILNTKLNSSAINDYAPNGLQVEGKREIKKNYYRCDSYTSLIEKRLRKTPMQF